MSNPTITVTPPPDSLGVPLGQEISILFDTEIDIGSIFDGSIVITGIRDQLFSGPDLFMFANQSADIYSTMLDPIPSLTGIIDYTVSIKRIDSSGNEISIIDTGDDPDSGNKYSTLVTLNPVEILKPMIKYGVMVSTDVTLNTVFDTQYTFNPTSSGKIIFTGPYSGTSSDYISIKITSGTTYQDIQFDWWKDSTPSVVNSINSANKRTVYLSDGVNINFDKGTYTIGDIARVKVIPADNLASLYGWSFTTGSGSVVSPKAAKSTYVNEVNINDGILSSLTSLGDNEVTYASSNPANQAYQVNETTADIVITYPGDINVSTFSDAYITITSDELFGDIFSLDHGVQKSIGINSVTVSGDTITIQTSGFTRNSVINVNIAGGKIEQIDGKIVAADKLTFITRFDAFYATPSYVSAVAGDVIGDMPEILLAELIGIESVNLHSIYKTCINKIAGMPQELRDYVSSAIREYVGLSVAKTLLENSGKITGMSKSIDSFRISFKDGRNFPLYNEIKDKLKRYAPIIKSCGERGLGQKPGPVTFEKSLRSSVPNVRHRIGYIRGNVPGLNSDIVISTTDRKRFWDGS